MKTESTAKLKYGGWGVAIGAVVVMIIGFSWGGWVTAKTANKMSEDAVVQSHGSICAAQFMMGPNQAAKLKELKEVDSWDRRNYIEKGGWDKMPGEENARIYVSSACVEQMEIVLNN